MAIVFMTCLQFDRKSSAYEWRSGVLIAGVQSMNGDRVYDMFAILTARVQLMNGGRGVDRESSVYEWRSCL